MSAHAGQQQGRVEAPGLRPGMQTAAANLLVIRRTNMPKLMLISSIHAGELTVPRMCTFLPCRAVNRCHTAHYWGTRPSAQDNRPGVVPTHLLRVCSSGPLMLKPVSQIALLTLWKSR
jgi:hypothetical protein